MEEKEIVQPEAEVTETIRTKGASPELEEKLKAISPYMLEAIKDRIDELPTGLLEALAYSKPIPRIEKIRYKLPFNRHEIRTIAVECLYQYLLLQGDMRQILRRALKGSNQVDSYLYSLTIGTAENAEKYKEEISKLLRSDWEFDRLSLLEQAILLMAFQEIEENGTEKPIVINEAVNMAKHYCDDQSYKLINGVLDQL